MTLFVVVVVVVVVGWGVVCSWSSRHTVRI